MVGGNRSQNDPGQARVGLVLIATVLFVESVALSIAFAFILATGCAESGGATLCKDSASIFESSGRLLATLVTWLLQAGVLLAGIQRTRVSREYRWLVFAGITSNCLAFAGPLLVFAVG